MTTLTPELIATLRQLSPAEREVVRDLLDEGDGPADARTSKDWAAELQRRIEDIESGRVVLRDADAALDELEKRFREKHGR